MLEPANREECKNNRGKNINLTLAVGGNGHYQFLVGHTKPTYHSYQPVQITIHSCIGDFFVTTWAFLIGLNKHLFINSHKRILYWLLLRQIHSSNYMIVNVFIKITQRNTLENPLKILSCVGDSGSCLEVD